MADLIDRHDAYKVLTEYYNHHTEAQHKSLKESLNRVPEAVVMCKDCKYYTSMIPNKNLGICSLASRHLGDYGFCSEGERKENG